MSLTPKVGFLLGAGVSIPCGAPSTELLTDELLAFEIPYFRHTDGRYYRRGEAKESGTPAGLPDLSQIRAFLDDLRSRTTSYYDDRVEPAGCEIRKVNYEDLVYLAVQVSEGINRERDNPALTPFTEELKGKFGSSEVLSTLADETVALITDHVTHRLQGLVPIPGHLACVLEACVSLGVGAVPVLSLNHDCLIETMLRNAGVDVNDMLHIDDHDRRVLHVEWHPDHVNVVKLHGGINWFRWRPKQNRAAHDRWDRWIGNVPDRRKPSAWTAEDRPSILVGRFNKELAYAGAPYTELFACARGALRNVMTLIISGYSFGDKAVNTMIIDWLYGAPKGDRRIAVAHRDPASVKIGARGAISDKWDGWVGEGVLMEIPDYLGDISWPDLAKRIAR